MRKVMIGTPCYDGRIDVWYTNSLINTIKLIQDRGLEIDLVPMWVSFDALIQRSRNDTVQLALEGDFDDLVWIDSDIEWEPEWLLKLLEYEEDVVGGTYRKKGDDRIEYVLRQMKLQEPGANGLLEVDGLGTGFVKTSKKALQYLWDTSKPYIDNKDNKERRMIFDVQVFNNELYSEDIIMFIKLKEGGFKIYLDPAMTCNHIGSKKYKGDFQLWYEKVKSSNVQKKRLI